jgi:hypothetical protein
MFYTLLPMSIQFSCHKLLLSQEIFERLGAPDRVGVAVVRHLQQWDLSDVRLDPIMRDLMVPYLITLPKNLYNLLLAIEVEHPDLDRSTVVDGLLWVGLSDFLPAIRDTSLIAGKSAEIVTYRLKFGILVRRQKSKNYYWYWQYYDCKGKRVEMYCGKCLQLAIVKVREIGIPPDARPQRLGKSRKDWVISEEI